MKQPFVLLTISVLLSATLACSLGAATATPTAPPLLFPTATPSPPEPTAIQTVQPPVGTPVSFGGASLVIPESLASGAATEIVPESTDATNAAPWDIHPAYTQFTLQDYPLQDKFFQPQIFVYPAEDFAKIHEGAAATISALQTLLANPGNPLPTPLPFLPLFNAAQVFTAQPQVLQFQNGSGLRYLTEFAQYPDTVNNKDLFYTFQGLTSDGKYYVSAVLPVNADFLAADERPDSPVPPDGIPFDQDNVQQYYAAVVEKINGTAPDAFTPSLSTLDALLQSISVTGQ